MRLVAKILFTGFAILFVGVTMSPNFAAAVVVRNELTVGNSENVTVPANLVWSKEALAYSSELLADLQKPADALLKKMRDSGANSLQITRSGPALIPVDIVGKYKSFDIYNSKISISGTKDWGVLADDVTFQPSGDINVANYLVTFELGPCRLSFALFNWNTWFSPDCKVKVASTETYLQMSLVSWIDNAPSVSTEAYFDILCALKDIVTNKIDYQINDGRIYSVALEAIMRPEGIPLERPTDSLALGYRIDIDSQHRWNITFTMNGPNLQALADSVTLVRENGVKFLYFGSPRA